MLKRSLRILCLTSIATISMHSSAMSGNGHELLKQCVAAKKVLTNQAVSSSEQVEAAFCMGFIRGISQMGNNMTKVFCSNGSTLKENTFVVLDFMKRNENYLSSSAGMFVVKALQEKYPCK